MAPRASQTNAFRSGSLLESARPHLENLQEKTGSGVTLELFFDMRNILLFALNGLRVVSFSLGDVMPCQAAAGGKVTLAHAPPDNPIQGLSERMFPFTPNALTDLGHFVAELKTVRRKGYSMDLGETQPSVNVVAVPFFSYDDHPAGAVVAMVQEAAEAISARNVAPGSQLG